MAVNPGELVLVERLATSATVEVVGASGGEGSLHNIPYRFRLLDGSWGAWTAYQVSPIFEVTGLSPGDSYQVQHTTRTSIPTIHAGDPIAIPAYSEDPSPEFGATIAAASTVEASLQVTPVSLAATVTALSAVQADLQITDAPPEFAATIPALSAVEASLQVAVVEPVEFATTIAAVSGVQGNFIPAPPSGTIIARASVTLAGVLDQSVIHSPGDATGLVHPVTGRPLTAGDVWNKYDESGHVLAAWYWDPPNWVPTKIRSEYIHNLDVDKLTASAARLTLAVAEQIISDAAYHEVLTTDKLNAGEGNINNLVAQQFATALADIIQARIENLVVTEGANINVAVIQKLAAEVINSGEFKTLIDTSTGLYATMDAGGFRVVDSGAVSGELRTLINLGPTGLDLLTLGTGSSQVTIDNSGGISANRLSVDDITLSGKPIENTLDTHRGRLVAWKQIFGANSRELKSQDYVLYFGPWVPTGRVYRLRTTSAIVRTQTSSVNPMLTLHRVIGLTGGSSEFPHLDWSGSACAESTAGPYGNFRSLFPMEKIIDLRNRSGEVRLHCAVSLRDLANQGWARVDAPVHPFQMYLEDLGTNLPELGIAYTSTGGGGGEASKTRYTKVYTATGWATYFRGGNRDTSASKPTQGRAGGSSYHRSCMFTFPSMVADLSGATIFSITLRSRADHWWYGSGGTGSWCWHGDSGIPSTSPALNFMRGEHNWPRGASREASIIPEEFEHWQSGARKGFGFDTSSTSETYYGLFSPNLSEHTITVEYEK